MPDRQPSRPVDRVVAAHEHACTGLHGPDLPGAGGPLSSVFQGRPDLSQPPGAGQRQPGGHHVAGVVAGVAHSARAQRIDCQVPTQSGTQGGTDGFGVGHRTRAGVRPCVHAIDQPTALSTPGRVDHHVREDEGGVQLQAGGGAVDVDEDRAQVRRDGRSPERQARQTGGVGELFLSVLGLGAVEPRDLPVPGQGLGDSPCLRGQ